MNLSNFFPTTSNKNVLKLNNQRRSPYFKLLDEESPLQVNMEDKKVLIVLFKQIDY